jgi:hypothetical protein
VLAGAAWFYWRGGVLGTIIVGMAAYLPLHVGPRLNRTLAQLRVDAVPRGGHCPCRRLAARAALCKLSIPSRVIGAAASTCGLASQPDPPAGSAPPRSL